MYLGRSESCDRLKRETGVSTRTFGTKYATWGVSGERPTRAVGLGIWPVRYGVAVQNMMGHSLCGCGRIENINETVRFFK